MFSIARRSLPSTSKPLPCRAPSQEQVVRLSRKYHAKVSALPFAFSGDDVVRRVAPWVSAGAMGNGLVRSLFAKYLPHFGFEPMPPDDLRAVYIPVWFVDGEVTGVVNNSGTEESLTIQSLASYMPGFSFHPLSTLSFSQPALEELAVPFTPELQHQHGLDVSCIPYSISPVSLPEVIKSMDAPQSKFLDSRTLDRKSVEFSMLAAYPVLLPVYMMKYDSKVPNMPEQVAITCIIQAHSKDGLGYFDIGTREFGDLLRGALNFAPDSWMQKLSPAADKMQDWDVVYGTSYGFSSIGIPGGSPGPDKTIKALSDFLDRKIQSKPNMDMLAEYGVDMDHPCVRVYTKEEVDANRKFLAASNLRSTLRSFIRGVSARETEMNSKSDGKRVVRPEGIQKLLNERKEVLEKQRDDLKPRWVRDWEDSRGQDRPSVPP